MEIQVHSGRQPGTRTATSPKVTMDSRPMSTFTQLMPGSQEAEEQMKASAYSLRNSQDTASAKEILANIEAAVTQGHEVLTDFITESQELSDHIKTLDSKANSSLETVPGDITAALQALVDSIRSEFVAQTQENQRLEKQINLLKHDRGVMQQQADDQSRRVAGMEEVFHITPYEHKEEEEAADV